MEYDIEPVYVKDMDVNNISGNIILKLCYGIHKLFPGEMHGAQKMSNYFKLYPRSNRTRAALIVRGIDIDNKHIDIFDDNPMRFDNSKSERVLLKDLPASVPPMKIMDFLRGYSNITVRSKVIYAKERTAGDEMSPFINGDRIVYISPNVTPPLPKEAVISGHSCRIWHASQKNYCKRCAQHGHRTIDVDQCDSYDPDSVVAAFRSDSHPLSNFYLCTIVNDDITFRSSEHYYQHAFCMHCERPDIAQKVIDAPTAKVAKQISTDLKSQLHPDLLATWFNERVHVMINALKLKWNYSGRFRQALMTTTGLTIAEATQDSFWGVGVAPNLAQQTRPSKFLGANHLGRLLMGLRDEVAHRELASHDDHEFNPPVSLASSNATSNNATNEPQPNSSNEDEPQPPPSNDNPQSTPDSSVNSETTPSGSQHDPSSSTSGLNDDSHAIPIPNCDNNSDSVVDPQTVPGSSTSDAVIDPDSPSLSTSATQMETESSPPESTSVKHNSPSSGNCEPLNTRNDVGGEKNALPSQTGSSVNDNPKPTRPPRKRIPRSALPNTPNQRTIDNYVSRVIDSPGAKRKLSDGSTSPSSVQTAKATRTDGADEVS